MPYPKCKVYSDGSHYIAIPHTERPYRPRRKPHEEVITVTDEISDGKKRETESAPSTEDAPLPLTEEVDEGDPKISVTLSEKSVIERQMTKKELFEELYEKYQSLPRYKRKAAILKGMRPYFQDAEAAKIYVEVNLRRKVRNLISRRTRMTRKINLQEFGFFVTFTYDSALHTEESFKKGLKTCLRNFANRKGWKFVGVWERSPKKKRLHFHGLFYIPEGTLPGKMLDVEDYNFNTRKRQKTHQNTYFNERFGRSDFEPIEDRRRLGGAIAYIVKYIEKTGEKIVYSRGLPQFFLSDVMEEDIVCPFGVEDQKLLLYDDFSCWDEGEYKGKASKEVIAKMPKSN